MADAEVTSGVHSQWGEPGSASDFMDSPYAYRLAWFQRGQYWTGFEQQVRQSDLAVVPAEFRSPAPGRIGRQLATGRAPEGSNSAAFVFPFHLPFERTEYYLADGVQWLPEFQTWNPQGGFVETAHTPSRSAPTGQRPPSG